MKDHTLVMREVDRSIFEDIVSGKKTIETRAATEKYRAIKSGNTLTFKCGEDKVTKVVEKSQHYKSLEDMFTHLPMALVLPNAVDLENAKAIYYSFPKYEEKIATYGIMAFSLAI